LLANDNTISGANPFLTTPSNDGTLAAINLPGVYAIAISAAGRNPVSVGGNIFNYGSPTEISGPDGPGGINPHIGWTGEGAGGNYKISLTGSDFFDLPAPGAAALLGLAALVGRSRRRLS
jgi:uncharacterized protein (TIGR03382 family)